MAKITDKLITKEAKSLMDEFLKYFEMDADVEVAINKLEDKDGNEEKFVDIKVNGENLGALIGYLGRNLRAFQKVFGMILNRKLNVEPGSGEFIKVAIDVSGYREKRKESLESMAKRIREEVLASGEPSDLPPMTSFERRIIHACLSEFDDVTTESFGEGADRHVRVSPKA